MNDSKAKAEVRRKEVPRKKEKVEGVQEEPVPKSAYQS